MLQASVTLREREVLAAVARKRSMRDMDRQKVLIQYSSLLTISFLFLVGMALARGTSLIWVIVAPLEAASCSAVGTGKSGGQRA